MHFIFHLVPEQGPCPASWLYYPARNICVYLTADLTFADGKVACKSYGTQYGMTGRVHEIYTTDGFNWVLAARSVFGGKLHHFYIILIKRQAWATQLISVLIYGF